MKRVILLVMLVGGLTAAGRAQVIPLYSGAIPPGSEMLSGEQRVRTDAEGNIITIRNVSSPTLTVVRPEHSVTNGTALIICPGGGFQGLAWQTEGTATAEWCRARGITAFILKYRLMPMAVTEYVALQRQDPRAADSLVAPYVRLAVDDAKEAIRYVREHAGEYGIDPAKVGLIGYSAGGTLVSSVALTYHRTSRPDFVAAIYAYGGAIQGSEVPADAPPLFLAWATDDGIAAGNPPLYERWRAAGRSVEMHAFYTGGHGFSVTAQGTVSDAWTSLFEGWMTAIGVWQQPNR